MTNSNINVLLKHTASPCNREIMEFLHRNSAKMKKCFNIKVTIVMKPIKHKLPAVDINDTIHIGKSVVISEIKKKYADMQIKKNDDDDMRDYIEQQLATGDNDDENRSGDISKKLATEAFNARDKKNNTAKPKIVKQQSRSRSNDDTGVTAGQSLPSDLETDPMMAKFWDNQGL